MVAISSTQSGTTGRHSRESVLDAAMALLDAYGLPELSMRRIAKSLDLQVSALYWHFPNKQSFLAAISSRIVARPPRVISAAVGSINLATESLVLDFRDQLLTHRDGAELVSSSFALGLVELPVIEALREKLAEDHVPFPDAVIAADTLTHFTLGYVFHEQQRAQADSLGTAVPEVSLTPDAAAMSRPLKEENHGFLGGVRLILHGLTSRTERHSR